MVDPQGTHQPPHRDRWLLSYADLLTLLFSLFVVLFASAYHDRKHAHDVSVAVKQAFEGKPPPAPHQNSLNDVQATLHQHLGADIQSGKIRVSLESRGLVVQLNDASFFASGDDRVRPESYATIGEIAQVLVPLPNLITVEGHSDATAIHSSRFQDNWELSAARGVAVVRQLTNDLGLAPNRLSVTAYADTRPRSDNSSEDGRAQNRRVDIVILSETKTNPEAQPNPEAQTNSEAKPSK